MAKFYGNSVKTGKIGGSVFRIRYGETIETQYQPVIANPSTAKQVEVRSKMKLMSQLSAVLAPAIAMPRQGAVSPRNRFVKVNYSQAVYDDGVASLNIPELQLTSSAVGFGAVTAQRSSGTITVRTSSGQNWSRVVYVLVSKGADEKLRYAASLVVTTPGTDRNYAGSFYDIGGEAYVLAYGVRDNNDAARVVFGNLTAPTAEDVAKIITMRTLLESDITLSETRGSVVTGSTASSAPAATEKTVAP